MKNIIKVNNLSYSYDKEPVLKNVNLEINRGDFAAFIGSNGSGKSTFLKILLGLIKADKGEVKLFGEKVSQFDEWKKTGYISQQVKDFNKSFPATVKEIIAANLYHEMGFLKILKGKHDKKINKALKLVDMIKYKNRLIGNLSGGQQQRVFIARTLVTDPDIIFLDEPLVGVDAVVQDDFFDLINRLNSEMNITILMISHDIHVISGQANKIYCFSNGQLFGHDADNFDYSCYLGDVKGRSRIFPEHQHSGGDK